MKFQDIRNSEIIEEVLKNHHSILKKELPELEKLVYTIFKVHFEDNGDELDKVHRYFGQLKNRLESHIIKEERALFYMIMDYEKENSEELLNEILEGIKIVEKDNKEIKELVEKIKDVTNDYEVPPPGCATFDKTYEHLRSLGKETVKHMDLEEILFKRFK